MSRRMQEGGREDADRGSARNERWSEEQPRAGSALPPGLGGVGRDDAPDERLHWLVRTIETEIIPRLMLAHRAPAQDASYDPATAYAFSADDVASFARLVLGKDGEASAAHVDSVRADGATLEAIYLELLAPTARRLGALWEADLCDFTEVTVGLWRLQKVLYDLSPDFLGQACPPNGRRAILAPAPGSQHTFGLFMVAEFFRRAGWDVWGQPTVSETEIIDRAHREWFDLVALSVGCDLHIEGLASVILDIRRSSRNPGIAVMVGGPVFVAHPEYFELVGADGTAPDAPHALLEAESLVAARDQRRC